MAKETILQHWVLTGFVYPFLIIFAIVFGILEKTKLFGSDKKQLNAIVAFVVGIIFVSAVEPKLIVENLVMFLSVAIVIVFVVLLIWGFATGSEPKFENTAVKIIVIVVAIIAVTIFLFIVTGIWDTVIDTLFEQSWSEGVWTNIIFILVIAAALALMIGKSKSSG